MSLPFATPFDEALARRGPPAVFTVDPWGQLRLSEDRTREAWERARERGVEEPPLEPCHCLFRDRATRWVQYVLVTSPALCADHPRAEVRRYPDEAAALAALRALGRPPLADALLEP